MLAGPAVAYRPLARWAIAFSKTRKSVFLGVPNFRSFYSFQEEGTRLIPEKQVCDLIDAIWKSGVTGSREISRIIERDNGI
jgi:hypothetical protein